MGRHNEINNEQITAAICSIREEATQILFDIGASTKLTGFYYTASALSMIIDDPSLLHSSITKTIYPKIAKMYGTTASATERAIRVFIADISSTENKLFYEEKFFRNNLSIMKKGTLSNYEFISLLGFKLLNSIGK